MISIIMPAYNEEKNIGAAIASIQQQTYTDFQLIIVNDGSTDGTATIVQEKIMGDERIVFLSPGKIGKVPAYNLASQYVKGDWIYFMGADDQLPLDAFEKWNKEAQKWNPAEKVALRARMKMVSDSSKYDGLVLPKKNTVRNFSGPLTLLSKAMHRFILPIPDTYPNEDTWWSCCIEHFADHVSLIEDIVVYYRVHEGNSISRTSTFALFNEKYHIRQIIRRDFVNRFNQELTVDQKSKLQRELKLEEARYQGKRLPILLASGIPMVHRLRLLFLSSKCFYALKVKFDRFFLGH